MSRETTDHSTPDSASPATELISDVGGIVLCGGRSSRMGTPKHLLPFGGRTMLQHVVGTLAALVRPIVVVGAPGQELPELPAEVLVARDEQPGLGPLAGLLAGLSVLRERCGAAYVTSCDVPLLQPQVVQYLIESRGDAEAAVFREGKFHHVLAGVYSTALVDHIRELIAAGRLRPLFLVQESKAAIIDVEAVGHLDPQRHSFRNVNTPEDYEAVLQIAGLKE